MYVHPVEVQMSAVQLTAREEIGEISRWLGIVPQRTSQPPMREPIAQNSIRYCWPPLASAGRPAPRRA